MNRAKKLSHSTQRKRVMSRHKLKVNGRRLTQFMQENQVNLCHTSSSIN